MQSAAIYSTIILVLVTLSIVGIISLLKSVIQYQD